MMIRCFSCYLTTVLTTARACLIFLLSTPWLLICCPAAAQQASIDGRVSDGSSDEALEYTNVLLYRAQDSTLADGVVTDAEGVFQFLAVSVGTYYLLVQFVGYETGRVDNLVVLAKQSLSLEPLALLPSQQLLSEIQVSGQKASVYHKIDRQVYDAGQFQSATGGTATDVLRNVPSVALTAEGGITVRGATGFTLLINGKPVQSDPSLILNQLPANAVENIEIVTAPSAKYDPEGTAGIINIITKQGATDGLFVQVNVKGGLPSLRDYDNGAPTRRWGTDVTLYYQKGPWNVSLGASYLRNDLAGRREGDVFTVRGDTLTRFPSDGERSFDERAYTARATLGYVPNEQNSFSLGLYAGKRSKDRTADILYFNNRGIYLPEDRLVYQTSYFNENLRIRRGDFLIGSLDYTRKLKKQATLQASLLYEYTGLGGPTTNLNLSGPQFTDTIQHQYNTNDNPLYGVRGQLDYSLPLGPGTLEAGYQYRFLNHRGDFVYQERTLGTQRWNLIPEFSSQVDLTRQIHAFYGQYGGQIGKLTYTAGARLEVMDRRLLLTNPFVDSTYRYDLVKLYPAANLRYQVQDDLQLKAAYSKRVERTTTFKMNPFPEREHSETLEQGDPELLPEFVDLVELGVVKDFGDNSVFATAYFRHVQNLVNRVNTIYNDTILNRIYTNVGQGRSLGLEVGTEFNPVSWWKLYAGGNLFQYDIRGTFAGETVATNSWVYSVNVNTMVKLSSTLNVQGTLNYLSGQNTAQGEDSRFFAPSLTAQKSWLDGRLSATLQWLNIDLGLLSSNEQRITTRRGDGRSNGSFFTTTNYVYEGDVVLLNLSYRINQPAGKAKFIKSEFGDNEF
ncbi:MAG: TonB-dependent receptor [Tunicatimonas sp.]